MPDASFNSTNAGKLSQRMPSRSVPAWSGPGTPRVSVFRRREIARYQELHPHAGVGVTQILAAGEQGHVAQALKFLVQSLQPFPRHQDIDVLGKTAETMREQGHAAGDRIGDI